MDMNNFIHNFTFLTAWFWHVFMGRGYGHAIVDTGSKLRIWVLLDMAAAWFLLEFLSLTEVFFSGNKNLKVWSWHLVQQRSIICLVTFPRRRLCLWFVNIRLCYTLFLHFPALPFKIYCFIKISRKLVHIIVKFQYIRVKICRWDRCK